MNKFIGVASLLAGFSALALASTASAQPPQSVQIQSVQYRGPACPPDSATVDLIDGNTSFLVTYNNFQAQAGPGIPLTESSKFCNLVIDVQFPEDYQFAVSSISYRGNARLDADVLARFRARYNFPGERSVSSDVRMGGMERVLQDFEVGGEFEELAWSPCTGRATLITTGTAQILAEPDAQGLVTAESTDGKWKMELKCQWRRCGE